MPINVPSIDTLDTLPTIVSSPHGELPLGNRGGLSDPYVGGTTQPDSKIDASLTGELWAKPQDPRTISYIAPYPSRPLGAFELAYDGTLIRTSNLNDLQRQRQQTAQADRIARTRLAPTVRLGEGGEHFAWIRAGRRIRPALPAGMLGAIAQTKQGAHRGVLATQTQMPISVATDIGATAARTHFTGPAPIVQTKHARAPQLLSPSSIDTPYPAAKQSDPTSFQWVYLAAAVAVVFLIVRAR